MCVVMIKLEVQLTNHKLIHCLYIHVVIVFTTTFMIMLLTRLFHNILTLIMIILCDIVDKSKKLNQLEQGNYINYLQLLELNNYTGF